MVSNIGQLRNIYIGNIVSSFEVPDTILILPIMQADINVNIVDGTDIGCTHGRSILMILILKTISIPIPIPTKILNHGVHTHHRFER